MKKKYLAYYENEWPANIAELTAVENKPFVGYLKDQGVQFTVVPVPVEGPADNEIWYTTTDGNPITRVEVVTPDGTISVGGSENTLISNTYENGIGKLIFDKPITILHGCLPFMSSFFSSDVCQSNVSSITLPKNISEFEVFALSGCIYLTELYYMGTIEQWNQIEKPLNADTDPWYFESPISTIHCTDGDIIPAA